MQNPNPIAVDIGKDSLQIQTAKEAFAISTDRAGLRKFVAYLRNQPDPLVVCEATGGYERPLLEALRKAKIPYRLVSPARIRAFALSEGIKAKTDRIDARLILRFAHEKKLTPTIPLTPTQQALADLLDRRSHLTEQIAREKNRLQKAPKVTAGFIRKMLTLAERQLAAIDRTIRLHLSKDPLLSAQVRELTSVQGVGEVTAWSILAHLAEITTLGRNQLVALAGIAPFNRDSSNTNRKRSIFGGRAKLRRCLYMAAHTAATHNPVIKPYVHRLLARGKPYKCTIVAAMRKLLIHLQSKLKTLTFKPLAV
jgi:transposase